jgi:hypothetical protein
MINWHKTGELLPESGHPIMEKPSEQYDAARIMMIKAGTVDTWLCLPDVWHPVPPQEWAYLTDVFKNIDELAIAAEDWKRSKRF